MTEVYMWMKGLEANLPAPGIASRLYLATDKGRWYLDEVTHWERTNLNPMGVYNSATTYTKHDLVTYNGEAWRALQTVTGVTPVAGVNWEKWIAKGDVGPSGTVSSGAFIATQTASQVDLPINAFTKVLFGGAGVNQGTWFDITNSRYLPLQAGYFTFHAKVVLSGAGVLDQKPAILSFYKNGVRVWDLDKINTSGTAPQALRGGINGIIANGTTDYFELFVYHNSSATAVNTASTASETWFSGRFTGT